MKQLVMIPFFIFLALPAIVAGFLWQFVSEGFALGREKAEEACDEL